MPTRGCGERKEGGLYLTVPLSPYGKPVEAFLVDPVIPWTGGTLRGPEMFNLPDEQVKHVVLGVGASFYPYCPDYVEETRVMGISKRVSLNIDLSGLVPGESRLLLMHPKAIPEFVYVIPAFGQMIPKGADKNPECPKGKVEAHLCVGDLWPLSVMDPPNQSSDKHSITTYMETGSEVQRHTITTPSTKYVVSLDGQVQRHGDEFSAGIFLKFPYFTFEFVSKSGNVPRKVAEKFEASKFDLSVVPE